jgi:hypothetical protein
MALLAGTMQARIEASRKTAEVTLSTPTSLMLLCVHLCHGVAEANAQANAEKQPDAGGPGDRGEGDHKHAQPRRAESHADADLACALLHRVGDHREKADSGQPQRHSRTQHEPRSLAWRQLP